MFAKKVSSLIKDVAVEVAPLGGREVVGSGVKLAFHFPFYLFGLGVSLKQGDLWLKFIQGKCCLLRVEWPAWSFWDCKILASLHLNIQI